MFVHVYGSEKLREWVVEFPDEIDDAAAMAEALRRVKAGDAGEGREAAAQYIALIPGGRPA